MASPPPTSRSAIHFVSAGTHLRALASNIRVHGHLPTPAPVIADRILVALFGATDAAGVVERPHARGLCDVEIDLVGALLWHLLPPAGWRLPSVGDIELVEHPDRPRGRSRSRTARRARAAASSACGR